MSLRLYTSTFLLLLLIAARLLLLGHEVDLAAHEADECCVVCLLASGSDSGGVPAEPPLPVAAAPACFLIFRDHHCDSLALLGFRPRAPPYSIL